MVYPRRARKVLATRRPRSSRTHWQFGSRLQAPNQEQLTDLPAMAMVEDPTDVKVDLQAAQDRETRPSVKGYLDTLQPTGQGRTTMMHNMAREAVDAKKSATLAWDSSVNL